MSESRVGKWASARVHWQDRISVVGTVINCCILAALLVLFNGYPDRIGFVLSADQPSRFIPILAPGFLDEMLTRLNVLWALSLSLAVVNLTIGRWTPATRVVDVALTLFGAIVSFQIISMPLFGFHPELVGLEPSVRSVADAILPWLEPLLKVVIGIGAAAAVISLIPKLHRLSRSAYSAA